MKPKKKKTEITWKKEKPILNTRAAAPSRERKSPAEIGGETATGVVAGAAPVYTVPQEKSKAAAPVKVVPETAALPIYQRDTYTPAEAYAAILRQQGQESIGRKEDKELPVERTPLYKAVVRVRSGKSPTPTLEEVYAEKVLPIYLKDTYVPTVGYGAADQRVELPERQVQAATTHSRFQAAPAPSRFQALPTVEGLDEREALRQESRLRSQMAKGVSPEELGARAGLREQRLQNLSAQELEKRQEAAVGHLEAAERALADRERETIPYAARGGTAAAGGLPYAAGVSAGEWTEKDRALYRERDKWQGIVNDQAARYYYRENQEQAARLSEDQAGQEKVRAVEDILADLRALGEVAAGEYGDRETREALMKKYGLSERELEVQAPALMTQLQGELERAKETVKDAGYDYDRMTAYQKRMEQIQRAIEGQKQTREFAEKHPVLSSAASILAGPAQGVDYLGQLAKGYGHSDPTKLESYVPANVYEMNVTNFVRNVRGTVARRLEEKYDLSIGDQNVASFLYQTGMSMGDFLFNALITGNFSGGLGGAGTELGRKAASNLSLAIMGSGAAANTTAEAIERGLSNRQAYTLGAIAGVAEIITEKVSLDALLDRTALNKSTMGYLLKNIAAEGSEEIASDLINWAGDVLVAKDKSQWSQAIQGYMAQGLGEKEAFQTALKDQIISMGWSGLGGALSGGVMAGGHIAVNGVIDSYQNRGARMEAEKTAPGEGAEYRAVKPQNVEMPTVPLIELSKSDIQGVAGVLPQTGEILRQDAITRARKRLGLDQRSAAYIPASNVMRDGNEYVLKLTKGTLNKMLHPAAGAALPVESIVVMDNLERIANNGVYFKSEGDRDARQQIPGWDHLMTTVYIDGVPYSVDMRVKLVEERPGSGPDNVLYYYSPEELLTIKKVGSKTPTVERRALNMNSELEPTSDTTVPQKAEGVKRKYTQGEDPLIQDIRRLFGKEEATEEAGERPYQSSDPFIQAILDVERGARFAKEEGTDSGLVFDKYVRTTLSTKTAEQINTMAKALGVRVRFVDRVADGKANASISGREILVERNNKNPVLFLLGHEWTHRVQELAPREYREFREAIREELSGRAEEILALYEGQGRSITYEQALDEAVADYAGQMLKDGRILDEFIARHRGNRNLLERFAEAIRELIGVLTGKEKTQAQKAEQKLREALEAAAEQAGGTETAATEGGGVRLSAKEAQSAYVGKSLTEDGSIYSYDFLTSLPDMEMTVLPEISGLLGADGKISTSAVVSSGIKSARSVGTEHDGKILVRNSYTGIPLLVTNKSIRHGLNGSFNRMLTNARLGAVIGNIVKNAVPINSLHNKAQRAAGTYAMAAYATDSTGREFVAVVTVEQYDGNVAGIEAYDVTHAVSGRQKNSSQASTKLQGFYPIKAAEISISDFLNVVKSTHQSILPEDVLVHFGEIRNQNGDYSDKVRFSLKDIEEGGQAEERFAPRDDLITREMRGLFEKEEATEEAGERPYQSGDPFIQAILDVERGARFAKEEGTDSGLVFDKYVRTTLPTKTAEQINTTAKALGVRVRFVDRVADGEANASISGREILVERNNKNPVLFLLGHEWTHRVQELAPREYREFREAIREELSGRAEEILALYEGQGRSITYEQALDEAVADYAGQMLKDGRILDEFIARHRGNRNLLERFAEAIRELIGVLTGKEKTQAQKAEQKLREALEAAAEQAGGTETAATEGGGTRLQIKETADGKKYVKADRQVIFGNDPDSWGEQVEEYINGKIRKGEDVTLLTEDGDELKLTEKTAGKASFAYRPDGSRMSDDEYYLKVNAEAHIDELAQVSERGKEVVTDEGGKHGTLAKDGWNYRTAYFQDFDGRYYRLRISVAQGEDGKVVYNIGNIKERSFPIVDSSSAEGGALHDGKTPSVERSSLFNAGSSAGRRRSK